MKHLLTLSKGWNLVSFQFNIDFNLLKENKQYKFLSFDTQVIKISYRYICQNLHIKI